MKKIWYSIIASLALIACDDSTKTEFQEGTIKVNVQLQDYKSGPVVLELVPPGPKRLQLDTVEVDEKGMATFNQPANYSAFYSVYIPGKQGELRFVAEPGDIIELSANANTINASVKIGGTAENVRLDSLITFIKATKYFTDSLNTVFQKAQAKQMHHALMGEFQKLYGQAKIKEEKYVLNYVLDNPGQLTNLIAINSLDRNRHRNVYQMVDSALMVNYNNNENAKKFHSIVKKIYPSFIGKPAPNFTLLDRENKQVSLSDFKGKYVLLDFWATWCRPCIQEIPNLKRMKTEFGGEKFEIISVCIDRNNPGTITTWNRIDDKFKTNWIQLFDGNGEATAKKYKVEHFPTLLIVDPEGNIADAGDHIRGETAYQIIKKLVGNE